MKNNIQNLHQDADGATLGLLFLVTGLMLLASTALTAWVFMLLWGVLFPTAGLGFFVSWAGTGLVVVALNLIKITFRT